MSLEGRTEARGDTPGPSADLPTPSAPDRAARAEAGRVRAAETKRLRSWERLTASSLRLFTAKGWYATRVEDIAADAGVSTATAYNHFANKYDLLSAAYAPLLQPTIERTRRDVADEVPIEEALDRAVRSLARVTRRHAAMTVAMLAAIPEIFEREGPQGQPADPRLRVEFDLPVILILESARDRGLLRPRFDPIDVAMVVTGTLLLRVLTRPAESARVTGDLLLQSILHGLLV